MPFQDPDGRGLRPPPWDARDREDDADRGPGPDDGRHGQVGPPHLVHPLRRGQHTAQAQGEAGGGGGERGGIPEDREAVQVRGEIRARAQGLPECFLQLFESVVSTRVRNSTEMGPIG